MKPHITWILIVDGERARLLQNLGPGKGLSRAINGEFFYDTRATRDLGTDKPGRSFESASAARHAYEPKVDWHRAEKQVLCKEMAKIVNQGALEKSYERLVLIAPPQILGDLRQMLDDHAKSKIIGEMDKDLTHIPDKEIPKHLENIILL